MLALSFSERDRIKASFCETIKGILELFSERNQTWRLSKWEAASVSVTGAFPKALERRIDKKNRHLRLSNVDKSCYT